MKTNKEHIDIAKVREVAHDVINGTIKGQDAIHVIKAGNLLLATYNYELRRKYLVGKLIDEQLKVTAGGNGIDKEEEIAA